LLVLCDLPETKAVPRLSVIVPHLNDDSGLELTLISILENRGRDIEVLIVHDGRYSDPYGLDQDEAALIEADRGTGLMSQVNLATVSSCSPYIQVIMPGTIVDRGWYEESIALLADGQVSAICQPIACEESGEVVVGLESSALPHRRVTGHSSKAGSPLLLGSVFRKRTLKALGGWMEGVSREIAEVEMALMLSSLGIRISISESVCLEAPKAKACGLESGYEIGHACGQLACAYSAVEGSGIAIDSIVQRLGHLASGLMSPKTVAERLGWVMGIRNREYASIIQDRLALAEEAIGKQPTTLAILSPNQRKAA
jgi:hypothetical protein